MTSKDAKVVSQVIPATLSAPDGTDVNYIFYGIGIGGTTHAVAFTGQFGAGRDEERPEDARRLAACWNAFIGIPTEDFEGKAVDEYVGEQSFVRGMNTSAGQLDIGLTGKACQVLASAFAGQFIGSGAVNFLEVGMNHPEIGDFIVTMQRVEGETPATLRAKAEAERDQAVRALTAAGYTLNEGVQEWMPPLGTSASPLLDKIDQLTKDQLVLGRNLERNLVAMQAAWIEWKNGAGPNSAMRWIENTLDGPGLIPSKEDEHYKDAQKYFDANVPEY
jgi:hypothetical protein